MGVETKPAGLLVAGESVVAEDGAVLKVAAVTLTGAKTMKVGFERYGSLPAFEVRMKRRSLVRVLKEEG